MPRLSSVDADMTAPDFPIYQCRFISIIPTIPLCNLLQALRHFDKAHFTFSRAALSLQWAAPAQTLYIRAFQSPPCDIMVELSSIEEVVVKALEDLGAVKDTAIRTADDITKKCGKPKGLVSNALVTLAQKGVIKRVAREKAAGYYLIKK